MSKMTLEAIRQNPWAAVTDELTPDAEPSLLRAAYFAAQKLADEATETMIAIAQRSEVAEKWTQVDDAQFKGCLDRWCQVSKRLHEIAERDERIAKLLRRRYA